MKKFTVKDIALSAVIGASYVALVYAFQFMAFSDVQFRIAEVLIILVIFNPKLSVGIILGTFLANMINGPIDAIFGTVATIISLGGLILFRKKPIIGLLFPVFVNGFLISYMLVFMFAIPQTYLLSVLFVSFGQAAVLYGLGLPLYYYLNKRDDITSLLN